MATKTRDATATCVCNHCNTPQHRRDLDRHFLCAECRKLPGVTGYRDPNKRGLDSGGPEYWADTLAQLNIVGDEVAEQPTIAAASTPAKRSGQLTQVEQWRDSVCTSTLMPEVKLMLLRAEQLYGDYGTGASIFPPERELAAALGGTQKQLRRWLRLGRDYFQPHRLRRVNGKRG